MTAQNGSGDLVKEPLFRIGRRIYFQGRNRKVLEKKFIQFVEKLENERGRSISEEYFNITVEQRIAEEFHVNIMEAEAAYDVYIKFMKK